MIATKLNFRFEVPTLLIFGLDTLNKLHLQPMPGKKALLVISNGKSVRVNGYLDRTINELKQAGVDYVLFDKVQPNPLKATAEEGARLAASQHCDFVVALGGGSVMDCVKAIALNATNPGDLWDYVHGGTGKGMPTQHDPLPIVAITTTAGTGSEVDSGGVITNPETHEKMAVMHPKIFPLFSIVDPMLMLSVPPLFTAYQGFDALFHSTEGYISVGANLYSDMLEETVIRTIAEYLPIAVAQGDNVEARSRMAFANTLSGYSMMTASCTAEHSIEHALSAYHQELPHGAGLIMISRAYYTTMIRRGVCDDRFIRMARLMGKTDAAAPMDFIDTLMDLQQRCGVADLKMSDYGITPEEFPTMATNALTAMACLIDKDRQPLQHDDIVEILQQSYR